MAAEQQAKFVNVCQNRLRLNYAVILLTRDIVANYLRNKTPCVTIRRILYRVYMSTSILGEIYRGGEAMSASARSCSNNKSDNQIVDLYNLSDSRQSVR